MRWQAGASWPGAPLWRRRARACSATLPLRRPGCTRRRRARRLPSAGPELPRALSAPCSAHWCPTTLLTLSLWLNAAPPGPMSGHVSVMLTLTGGTAALPLTLFFFVCFNSLEKGNKSFAFTTGKKGFRVKNAAWRADGAVFQGIKEKNKDCCLIIDPVFFSQKTYESVGKLRLPPSLGRERGIKKKRFCAALPPSSVSSFGAARGACDGAFAIALVSCVGRWLRRCRACWQVRFCRGSPCSLVAVGAVWAPQSAITHRF